MIDELISKLIYHTDIVKVYFFEILSLIKLTTFYKTMGFLWSREDPFYRNKHIDTNKKYLTGKTFYSAQRLRRKTSLNTKFLSFIIFISKINHSPQKSKKLNCSGTHILNSYFPDPWNDYFCFIIIFFCSIKGW